MAAEAGVLRHPCEEPNYDSRRGNGIREDDAGEATTHISNLCIVHSLSPIPGW